MSNNFVGYKVGGVVASDLELSVDENHYRIKLSLINLHDNQPAQHGDDYARWSDVFDNARDLVRGELQDEFLRLHTSTYKPHLTMFSNIDRLPSQVDDINKMVKMVNELYVQTKTSGYASTLEQLKAKAMAIQFDTGSTDLATVEAKPSKAPPPPAERALPEPEPESQNIFTYIRNLLSRKG